MQNLCRDIFLRSKMDDGGWILVSVIANFNRMRLLTPDQTVIVDALIGSAIVELSADGLLMRPRDNWRNWVLPVEQRDPTAHAPAAMLYPALSSTSSAAPDRQATFERLHQARQSPGTCFKVVRRPWGFVRHAVIGELSKGSTCLSIAGCRAHLRRPGLAIKWQSAARLGPHHFLRPAPQQEAPLLVPRLTSWRGHRP